MSKKVKTLCTRKKILSSAMVEFASKGFNGTRISDIAFAAEVNQALIHYHFGNKEQLYRSIFNSYMKEGGDEYIKLIEKKIKSWETTPDVKLCAILYLIIAAHNRINSNNFNKLIVRELAERSEFIKDIIANHALPKILWFEKIIIEGIELGYFENKSPLLLTTMILVFIDNFPNNYKFFMESDRHDALHSDKEETLYKFLTEYTFKALRPQEGKLNIPKLDKNQRNDLDLTINTIKEKLEL